MAAFLSLLCPLPLPSPLFCQHVLDLGRLQIRWRSLIGENGRIKSSNVSRTSKPLSRELDLVVVEAPARVAVERPFVVAAHARNGSNAPALLVVQLLKDRMGTLLPCGPAIRVGVCASTGLLLSRRDWVPRHC